MTLLDWLSLSFKIWFCLMVIKSLFDIEFKLLMIEQRIKDLDV